MTEDQRHYEVDIIILDTILVRAGSAAGARDKARDMGFAVEDVREVADAP